MIPDNLKLDEVYKLTVNPGTHQDCGRKWTASALAIYRGVRRGKHLFRYVNPLIGECGAEIIEYTETVKRP